LQGIFWFLFFFHILVKVNLQGFSPFSFCFFDYSKIYSDFVNYSSFLICSLLSFAMIILSIFAFKNVQRIRSIPRQQRRQIRSMNKKDFQLLRCLFVHNIVYIICNLFFNLYNVYSTFMTKQIQTLFQLSIYLFLFNILNFIHHISYCTSFFIFIIISKAFRNEFKRF